MTNLSRTNLNRREAAGPKGEGRDSPSTFPAYPEYKDSGVEWLGEVPAHWEVTKLSYITNRIGSGKTPSGGATAYVSKGVPFIRSQNVHDNGLRLDDIVYIDEETDREMAWSRVRPLDVLINITGASIGRSCLVPVGFFRANVNQHVCVIRLDKAAEFSSWVAWSMKAPSTKEQVKVSQTGAAREGLNFEQLAGFYLCMPPLNEQKKISAFLDHETARIDALVEEQQRLIALLKEKRQAVISHAVTKGLDPDVPMKDSGVEWLGEVPAHWQIKRTKHVVRDLEQGWSPQCENIPVQGAHEWGVLKVGCVNNGRFNETENKRLPEGIEPKPELAIRSGDVLISRANTRELVGSCAVPTNDHPNLMMSDKLFRLRLNRDLADPRYLSFFMSSSNARELIEVEATGASSSMLNIGQGTILELTFPCPPLEEQVAIKDAVVNETWQLLSLAGQALELKKRLEERRSALISAAVTGKIDVRGWTPPADAAPDFQETRMEAV